MSYYDHEYGHLKYWMRLDYDIREAFNELVGEWDYEEFVGETTQVDAHGHRERTPEYKEWVLNRDIKACETLADRYPKQYEAYTFYLKFRKCFGGKLGDDQITPLLALYAAYRTIGYKDYDVAKIFFDAALNQHFISSTIQRI